jgi:hypothetical protein
VAAVHLIAASACVRLSIVQDFSCRLDAALLVASDRPLALVAVLLGDEAAQPVGVVEEEP